MGINSFSPANQLAAATAKTYREFGLVPVTTGAQTAVSATDVFATQVEFYGYKSVSSGTAPVPNTANVYYGLQVAMSDVLAPGAKVTYRPPLGTKINLKNFYVTGTTGDSVFLRYLQ
jgi:hypothetical protein